MLKQIEHYCRILDMMVTAHSQLRDRYFRYSLLLELLILILSALICATTFLDPEIIQSLQINPKSARLLIGSSSIVIFILSIISLRVDWKQKAENHGQVAEVFAGLKTKCRSEINTQSVNALRIQELCQECALELEKAPVKIPENEFLSLKALHLRKIEISKLIDLYPGVPVVLIRVLLLFRLYRNKRGAT